MAARLSVPVAETVLRLDAIFSAGRFTGPSMLAGGIIIAIMILPIITSVSREILRSVPDLQREAAYALGRDALGSNAHRGAKLRQERVVRRGDSRAGPRARRNDGGDDGDRQHAADRRVALHAGIHPGQRDRE